MVIDKTIRNLIFRNKSWFQLCGLSWDQILKSIIIIIIIIANVAFVLIIVII